MASIRKGVPAVLPGAPVEPPPDLLGEGLQQVAADGLLVDLAVAPTPSSAAAAVHAKGIPRPAASGGLTFLTADPGQPPCACIGCALSSLVGCLIGVTWRSQGGQSCAASHKVGIVGHIGMG